LAASNYKTNKNKQTLLLNQEGYKPILLDPFFNNVALNKKMQKKKTQ